MPKIDRRIAKTQQALMDALTALAVEQGYDSVTIKDITRRADVSYSTFFRHFKSKDELTEHIVLMARSNILEQLQDDMTPYEEARIAYRYISERRDLYRFCTTVPQSHPAIALIRKKLARALSEVFKVDNKSALTIEAIAYHKSGSIIELLRWWVKNDMHYTPEEMARIHIALIIDGNPKVAWIADDVEGVDD